MRFPFYFKGKRRGELAIPDDLKREDFELLQEQITNALWVVEQVLITDEALAKKLAGEETAQTSPSDSQTGRE